jgi:uncharacterized protein YktA (UPF0223 family)
MIDKAIAKLKLQDDATDFINETSGKLFDWLKNRELNNDQLNSELAETILKEDILFIEKVFSISLEHSFFSRLMGIADHINKAKIKIAPELDNCINELNSIKTYFEYKLFAKELLAAFKYFLKMVHGQIRKKPSKQEIVQRYKKIYGCALKVFKGLRDADGVFEITDIIMSKEAQLLVEEFNPEILD